MTHTAPFAWIPATVTAVDKSHKAEFSRDRATRGFYWRVTAECHTPTSAGLTRLAFSTTEPRAVRQADLAWLFGALESDLTFLAMYCANSVRDWPPIWAFEAGRDAAVPSLPFARWLLRATLHPDLRALRPW